MLTTRNIVITPEILALLSKLDEFKGAWRALGMLAPDRLLALRRVATIESIGSLTRIEGSKLSDRAVVWCTRRPVRMPICRKGSAPATDPMPRT